MKEVLKVIDEREILGKDVKIYGTIDEPLFLAKDVAVWLEERDGYTVARKVDEDEKVINTLCVGGQNKECTFLTEYGLIQVLSNSRKPIAKKILEKLNLLKIKRTPKQTQFELMLKNAIDIHLNKSNLDWEYCPWNDNEKYCLTYDKGLTYETEYKIDDYRVDFYFKNFDLIVEYDENAHKYQLEEDLKRQKYIENKYENEYDRPITFIRVKEGEEFEGIIKIISYLVHYAFVF